LATASESQQPVTHLNDINSITPGRVIVNNSAVTLFPDSPQTPRNKRSTTPSEKPGTLASNNNKFLLLGNGEEDSHQTAAGLDTQPSDLNNQPATTEKHTDNITENHNLPSATKQRIHRPNPYKIKKASTSNAQVQHPQIPTTNHPSIEQIANNIETTIDQTMADINNEYPNSTSPHSSSKPATNAKLDATQNWVSF